MTRYGRILLFLGGLLFLTTTAAAAGFHAPRIAGVPVAGNAINVTVENSTAFTAPRLRYKPLDAPDWRTCTLSNYTCRFPNGLEQTIYAYYFINGTDSSTRFPRNGTFKLPISTGNTRWKAIGRNFTATDPTNDGFSVSCAPWKHDFSCSYEHMQGAMIQSFGAAAFLTKNQTYREKSKNLSLLNYDDSGITDTYATCDINNSNGNPDYNCQNNNTDDPDKSTAPSGPKRQAMLINSLSWTGRQLGLPQLRTEGANYMNGSAENCDIWANDFDCGNVTDQGLVTAAAWESYVTTGNTTYRAKAVGLSAEAARTADTLLNRSNVTHAPALMQGLWQAYRMTENTTYRRWAANLSIATGMQCANASGVSPCSVETQSHTILAALDGYRSTGKNYYLHVANRTLHTAFSGSCNPWNNTYACHRADDQGLAAAAYWTAYRTLPVVTKRFHRPRITGTRKNGEPLTFTVGMRGDLNRPALYLRKHGSDTWTRCPIDRYDQSCTVSGDTLTQQTVYEYRFNASSTALPHDRNGSFRLLLASRNESTREQAVNLTLGTANFCDPWEDDFSCNFAHWNGWMEQGFLTGYRHTDNTTFVHHARTFGVAEYNTLNQSQNSNIACDQADGDFDCDPSSAPNGSVRQGRIIESLWNTYMQTGNASVRVLAENYTRGSADDCDVWSDDMDCASESGQGQMIAGYLSAYLGTGNISYLDIAERLGANVTGAINGSTLLGAAWKLYSVTGNTSYRNMAANYTGTVLDQCTNGNCTTVNYVQAFAAGITAHTATGNTSYYDTAYNIFTAGNNGTCDAWEDDYTCTDADEQGAMISLFWNAYAYDQLAVDGDVGINTTAATVTVDDTLNAACTVTNTVANSTLLDVNLSITASGFSIAGNSSVVFTNISAQASKNHTWTLTADSSGDQPVTCDARASNGWSGSAATTVTVEEQTQDTTTDSGGTESTSSIGGVPMFTPNNTYERYSFRHQDTAQEITALLDRYDRFNRSLARVFNTSAYGVRYAARYTANHSACLTGWRNHTQYEAEQETWLNVTYRCQDTVSVVAIQDVVDVRFAARLNTTTVLRHDTPLTPPGDRRYAFSDVVQDDPLYVRYTANGTGNRSLLDAPLVLLRPQTIPTPDRTPPNITVNMLNGTNLSAASGIMLTAGDTAANCTVTRVNGSEKITVAELAAGEPFTYPFRTGWNNLTISCADAAGNTGRETVAVLQAPDTGQQQPTVMDMVQSHVAGIAAFLLVLAGTALYLFRDTVAATIGGWWTGWNMHRMETHLQKGRPDRAIKVYDRITDWHRWQHGDTPTAGFWRSNVGGMGEALELYILMDIAVQHAQQGDPQTVAESWERLERLLTRFLERHPDSPARHLLEAKADELEQVIA